MLTPARFFFALGIAAQSFTQFAQPGDVPRWVGVACGLLGIFCQVLTGTTGPIQNNSAQLAAARDAAQQVKENAK